MRGKPKVALTAGVLFLLGSVSGAVISGCGGEQRSSEPAPAPEAAPQPASGKPVKAKLTIKNPPPAETSAARGPTPKTVIISSPQPKPATVEPSRSTSGTSVEVAAAEPNEVARPADFADWKRDEYEGAARDRDPQLAAALNYYGSHFAGKESAANFLVKLLELSSSKSPAVSPSGVSPAAVSPPANGIVGFGALTVNQPSSAGNTSFGEAVVAALVANGTPRSRQILVDIIDGKIKTGDSQADVAALKALAAQRDPIGDDLLFRLATSTRVAGLSGQPSGIPTALDSLALKQIAEHGSESLAVRLAEVMLSPRTTKAVYDRLWTCLRQPRAENLIAQVKLYLSPRSERATRDWLEQSLAAGSSAALEQLLGFPAGGASGGQPASTSRAPSIMMGVPLTAPKEPAPSTAARSSDPYALAERVWKPDVVVVIEERLRELEDLEGHASLLGLAAAIPNRGMRAATLRTLQRHWDEGPRELKTLAAASGANVEPGFLAVVKMLRREDLVKSTAAEARIVASARQASPAATRSSAVKQSASLAKKEIVRERIQVGQQWMAFSQELSLTACQRFRAAAEASREEKRAMDTATDANDLPFNLHPHAEVHAAYRLDWPDELHGKVAAAPTLRVRYVRTREKAAPAAVLGYYRRQVPAGKEHLLAGSVWIDNITVDRQADRTRSIDIFVAKANKNVVGRIDQEQELMIEILSIECEAIAEANPAVAGQ